MSVLLSLLLATDPFPNWESAPVHSVTLTDEGEVLVCNVAQATLEIFSATTPPVWLDAVSVGLDPVSVRVRPDSREAWVVNHVSDSVSVIDLDRRVTTAVLPVLDEPGDVIFAGSPERAYVSCSTDECLLVFDPNNLDAAPGRIDLLGEEPKALAVDPSGQFVYFVVGRAFFSCSPCHLMFRSLLDRQKYWRSSTSAKRRLTTCHPNSVGQFQFGKLLEFAVGVHLATTERQSLFRRK